MEIVQSDRPSTNSHYDASYFEWQRVTGEFGGWANVDKFRRTIAPGDHVLDFGCGGGFLLPNLDCSKRYGIEPNPAARETAQRNGVTAFESAEAALQALGPGTIDVIISDNALEHALEPWRELRRLRPLLKKGGRIHVVVPCENIGWRYRSDDINQHMHSWGPQSLGNLLNAAGFNVAYSRPYVHKWPPRGAAPLLAKFGRTAFNAASRLWGHLDRRWFQVEALAIVADDR